jgi:hypothetical protein
VSAREQISQALADKIRQMESAKDLETVAEDVLPQLEKFLESPEEKRLRRVRAGVISAGIGLGGALLFFLMSFKDADLFAFMALGVILFLIGIGMVINGFAFTIPRKTLADRSDEALPKKNWMQERAVHFPQTNFLSLQMIWQFPPIGLPVVHL